MLVRRNQRCTCALNLTLQPVHTNVKQPLSAASFWGPYAGDFDKTATPMCEIHNRNKVTSVYLGPVGPESTVCTLPPPQRLLPFLRPSVPALDSVVPMARRRIRSAVHPQERLPPGMDFSCPCKLWDEIDIRNLKKQL